MHVGAAVIFHSQGSDLPDRQIYANDLSLVDLVEPLDTSHLGVEHHFTDYTMCPDVYQFLSYCAGGQDSPAWLYGPGSPLARSARAAGKS